MASSDHAAGASVRPTGVRRFPGCLALLAGLMAVAACEPDREAAGVGGAGQQVVEIREDAQGVWTPATQWRISEAPLLEVGSESAPHSQFYGVAGAVRLADGRVAVADGGAGEVRWFGPGGAFLTSAGRPGGGPGEFRRLTRLFPAGADSLIAFDAAIRRVSVFAPAGEFARSFALEAVPPGSELVGVLGTGELVVAVPRVLPPAEGLARDSLLYVVLTASGRAADTLEVAPGGQRFQQVTGDGRVSRLTVPFGPTGAAASGRTHVYVGATERYEIRQHDPAAGSVRTIRRSVPPRRFTDADYERIVAALPQFREAFRPVPRPEYAPEFAAVIVDRDDNLWVSDYPDAGAVETAWSVFDAEGRLLGAVELPAQFRPMDIGRDYVSGVWTDDSGVERVRVYRLLKN